jgi:hypothetical protein
MSKGVFSTSRLLDAIVVFAKLLFEKPAFGNPKKGIRRWLLTINKPNIQIEHEA